MDATSSGESLLVPCVRWALGPLEKGRHYFPILARETESIMDSWEFQKLLSSRERASHVLTHTLKIVSFYAFELLC